MRKHTEIAYGTLQLANNAFATFCGIYLPFIYIETNSLDPGVFVVAIVMATVLQVLAAPIVGSYIHSAASKSARSNLLFYGSIPFAIGFVLVAMPLSTLSPQELAVWIISALALANVSRSIFEVSYTSMLADLSDAGIERTRLANVRQAFGTTGDAAASLLPSIGLSIGFASAGYALFGIFIGVWIIAASFWMKSLTQKDRRFVRDGKLEGHEQLLSANSGIPSFRAPSQPLWALMIGFALAMVGVRLTLGIFPFLIVYFSGDSSNTFPFMLAVLLGSIVGIPIWGKIAAHFGRRDALRASLVATGASLICLLLLPAGHIPLFLVLFFVIGLFSIAISSFGVALQADLVDIEEIRTGVRAPAFVAGIFVSVVRASQGAGTAAVAVILMVQLRVGNESGTSLLLYTFSGVGCCLFWLAALILRWFPKLTENDEPELPT